MIVDPVKLDLAPEVEEAAALLAHDEDAAGQHLLRDVGRPRQVEIQRQPVIALVRGDVRRRQRSAENRVIGSCLFSGHNFEIDSSVVSYK